MWHGYYGIENLGLDNDQRATLVDALKTMIAGVGKVPAKILHWRIRPDGDAAIFEADFFEDSISINAFKQRLGTIFGIDPAVIDHLVTSVTFGTIPSTVVTLSVSSIDRLRVVLFGMFADYWPSWRQSRDEAAAYLAAHADEWEPSGVEP